MKTLLVIGIVAIVLWIVYGAYRIAVFCEKLKWLRREKRAEEWAEKNADLLNSGMIYGRSSASKFNPAFVIYYSAFNLCKRLSKHLDELREKRVNMTCEELGSEEGIEFMRQYENFVCAAEAMNDVERYLKKTAENEKEEESSNEKNT